MREREKCVFKEFITVSVWTEAMRISQESTSEERFPALQTTSVLRLCPLSPPAFRCTAPRCHGNSVAQFARSPLDLFLVKSSCSPACVQTRRRVLVCVSWSGWDLRGDLHVCPASSLLLSLHVPPSLSETLLSLCFSSWPRSLRSHQRWMLVSGYFIRKTRGRFKA